MRILVQSQQSRDIVVLIASRAALRLAVNELESSWIRSAIVLVWLSAGDPV
jgi:hypothetical protein